MTTANRAFFGALLGALIALFMHPLSRPWLQYSFFRFAPSHCATSSPHLAKTLQSLDQPINDENLSLYLQVAAEKILKRQKIEERDKLLLAELCRNAAEKDPLNAFWRQSEAVFQNELGNKIAAKTAWSRASKRPNWNDFQNQLTQNFLKDFIIESGAEMSWHSAVAIQLRTSAIPQVTSKLGKSILSEDQSLLNRGETFMNAMLIRDQAKSKAGAYFGYQLAELAATGPFNTQGSKRERTFLREEFPTELHKVKQSLLADHVARGLRENDAFQALVFSADTNKTLTRLSGQSILLASLPGALLFGALISGILLLATYLIPIHKLGDPLRPIYPTLTAFIVGLTTYVLTKQVSISLWALLIIALFSIHPPINLISPALKIPRLSLIFGSFTAVCFVSIVVAGAIVSATPFTTLSSSLPDGWWNEPTIFLSQGLLLVSGAFILFCQVSAYRLRRPAGRFCIVVARNALTQACFSCIFCSIVSTPAAIYWDHKINIELKKIALNETAYYLNQ